MAMDEKVIVTLVLEKKKIEMDIEIPTDITVRDLITALNEVFKLGINLDDVTKCHLQMENPIALLRGNKTLLSSGIREGSVIYYTE